MDTTNVTSDESIRSQVLREACTLTCGERQRQHGEPSNNMKLFATFHGIWRAYNVHNDPSHDAAIIMVLAKLARIAVGSRNVDNYVDGAAYLAIAAECLGLAPK